MATLTKPPQQEDRPVPELPLVMEEVVSAADNPAENDRLSAVKAFLNQLYLWAFQFCRLVGIFSRRFTRFAARRFWKFYRKHLSNPMHLLDQQWLRFKKFCSKQYKAILFHCYNFLKFFIDAWQVVRNGYRSVPEEKNGFVKFWGGVRGFGRGVRANGRLFLRTLNYLFPAAAIWAFAVLISYVASLEFAVNVEYKGEDIGYIANETVFESAQSELRRRLISYKDETIDDIPKFSITVAEKIPVQTDIELTDTILKSSNSNIVEATGLTIDGVFYGAVKNGDLLEDTLDSMKGQYSRSAEEGARVEFTKEVSTSTGLYLQDNIRSEREIIDLLHSQTQQDVYYTVVEGDTPSGVAQAQDMKLDELVALNPDCLTNFLIGKQLLVNKSQAFLPVKTIVTKTYTEEIPFETTYTESNSYYVGRQVVLREGQNGSQQITADIEYVDGIEVGRTILTTERLEEPVAKQVVKGTKEMPTVANYTGKYSGYGFVNPIQSGNWYISQGFKGSAHNAIDIAFRGNGYGTPVFASLAGTVTYAGWRGTYGNLVIINHGDGMQTWYAHNSKIIVSVGEQVARGQQIANVGSTGRSTGNHLHFMVVINGSYKNPLNYIPG